MLQELDQLESEARAKLAQAADADTLDRWRQEFLGNSGRLKAAMGNLKDVPKDQKPAVGARLNQLKSEFEEALTARRTELGATGGNGQVGGQGGRPGQPCLDPTEPGLNYSTGPGRRHIITRVRDELVEVFARMGFQVASGPELEDDEHNFVKLNIPAHHPAREPIDNYFIDDPRKTDRPRMLRSQTSTVQVRVMEDAVRRLKSGDPSGFPIRVVAPGRVYRPDTVDATHSFMFHQIEGLAIDRGLSMADLKSCLLHFARAYFGPEAEVRLRPSYFPFTEPSAEFDMKIRLRPDQPARWVELGGCGMVDPAVLSMCGIDPEEWSGFAFGFGIERLAMGKYAIPDIRMLFENDLRFLTQL
ncbi:MAG: phenylalanine--tRNA ligase subunit alpha [Phycisphaeraceae bacterium]|nr:phenylalanine--tRNA ligase subunit alpha [Phycisphaeraceae bacterium]